MSCSKEVEVEVVIILGAFSAALELGTLSLNDASARNQNSYWDWTLQSALSTNHM